MADLPNGGVESVAHDSSSVWRKRVAVLLALTLAAAGLLLLEHNPASASSAPKVVHAAQLPSTVDSGAVTLIAATTQLKGAASLMTQTLPDLDLDTRAGTADLAASAARAAGLSQQLAAVAKSAKADVPQANALAGQLQAALAATEAKAAVVNRRPITTQMKFCTFTIQIGPIIIDIPRLGIHIVIGPFFIHFRAPCFLSGIVPTRVP